MHLEEVSIPARDGFPLAGLHFAPPADAPKAVVQINSGTGIRKEFYSDFAAFLVDNGYAVVVYDYRGIGGSAPGRLADMPAQLSDWGRLDMAGVLDWINARYPRSHKLVVAHSMGAHLIGMMENYGLIGGIAVIAAGTGYWRMHPFPFRYFPAFMWHVYIPLTTRLVGYAPLKIVKTGENLPRNVARQWARWCTDKRYMRGEYGEDMAGTYYDKITVPIQTYLFDDDPIANRDNGRHLITSYYGNSTHIGFEEISARSSPTGAIGHFGFFRKKIGRGLWQLPLEWLDRRVAQLQTLAGVAHLTR